MRYVWLAPAPLVMLAVVLGAPGASGDPADSLAAKYRALVRDYQTRQLAFHKAINRAKTDADRRKALTAKPSPAEYAERFLELARADPKDEAGFDALNWVLTYAPHGPESDEALGLLAREHVGNKRLGSVLQKLLTWRSPPAEDLLREALARSPHREVRAQACYALATVLTAKARRPPDSDLEDGEGEAGTQEEAAPAKPPREEAEALYETLATDYGDVRFVRKKTYADLARTGLARLRPKAGRPETRPVRRRRRPRGRRPGRPRRRHEGARDRGPRHQRAADAAQRIPGRRGRARLLGALVTPLPGHVPARAVARDASARQAVRPARDQQRQEPQRAPCRDDSRSRSPGGRGGTAAAPAGRSPPCSASDRGRRSTCSTTRA